MTKDSSKKSEIFTVWHQRIANGQKDQYKQIVECVTSTQIQTLAYAYSNFIDNHKIAFTVCIKNKVTMFFFLFFSNKNTCTLRVAHERSFAAKIVNEMTHTPTHKMYNQDK